MLERLSRIDPYRVAACCYFVYGVVYMAGAIVSLTPERMGTFFGFVPWWAFYVAGAVLMLALPALVLLHYKWLTRIVALGPAGKALSLCLRQGRLLAGATSAADAHESAGFNWLFIAVAIVAAAALFRAGWGPQRRA